MSVRGSCTWCAWCVVDCRAAVCRMCVLHGVLRVVRSMMCCCLCSTLLFCIRCCSSLLSILEKQTHAFENFKRNGGCFATKFQKPLRGTNFQQCRFHLAMLTPAKSATSMLEMTASNVWLKGVYARKDRATVEVSQMILPLVLCRLLWRDVPSSCNVVLNCAGRSATGSRVPASRC